MTVFFRALVMLLTLVGLPAAWIYYGPLPANAQQVVDRFVEVAQEAVGWRKEPAPSSVLNPLKSAPRYEDSPVTSPVTLPVSQATFEGESSSIALASASTPAVDGPESSELEADSEMQSHLSLLKAMGVAHYSLEKWGTGFRFKCSVPLGNNPDFARQFEAHDADPLATVRQVVGEVSSWQNARNDTTQWR